MAPPAFVTFCWRTDMNPPLLDRPNTPRNHANFCVCTRTGRNGQKATYATHVRGMHDQVAKGALFSR